jgi:hypothetical protein
MLDTVPKDVKLTDVIQPLPVKPDNLELTLDGDKVLFSGTVRVRIIHLYYISFANPSILYPLNKSIYISFTTEL